MIVRRSTREQFARYVIAGIVNTACTYALLVLAIRWIDYRVAYTAVYILGVALGYWLQSRLVFRVAVDVRSAMKFPFVYVVQYVFGLALLWVLVETARIEPAWAALIVVIATVPVGFLLSRLVFAQRSGFSGPEN